MRLSRIVFVWSLVLLSLPVFAGSTLTEPETKKSFAAVQTVWSKPWVALGTGARERLGMNVYAMALYLEQEGGQKMLKAWLEGEGKLLAQDGKVNLSKAKLDQKFYEQIVNCECGRGVEITLVREVDGPTIRDTISESIAAALGYTNPKEFPKDIKDDFDRFRDYLNHDLKVGNQFKFYVSPKGNLSGTGPGGQITIKNPKFAKALLRVWIGTRPIQQELKENLVSNVNAIF